MKIVIYSYIVISIEKTCAAWHGVTIEMAIYNAILTCIKYV